MTHTCVHHCRHLGLRAHREQSADCPVDALLCQKHRDLMPPDAGRDAITQALVTIFDIEKIPSNVDQLALAQAAIKQDMASVEALLQEALPAVDWIHLDDIGLGHDWSGIRLALIFAAEHPHLQAAVGLVIGANDAKLALGRIDYANPEEFCRSIE